MLHFVLRRVWTRMFFMVCCAFHAANAHATITYHCRDVGSVEVGYPDGSRSRQRMHECGVSGSPGQTAWPAHVGGFGDSSIDPRRAYRAREPSYEPAPSNMCEKTGHPVVIATGNKVQSQTDFEAAGEMPLQLIRTYNARSDIRGIFGPRWLTAYDMKLSFVHDGGMTCTANPVGGAEPTGWTTSCDTTPQTLQAIKAFRSNGSMITYKWSAVRARYEDDQDLRSTWIVKSGSTWTLRNEDAGTETYDQYGRPVSMLDKHGIGWTYQYPTSGAIFLVSSITHTSGQKITFTRDANYRLTSVTAPSGTYNYGYTAAGMLNHVTYPGGSGTITYHYENANTQLLTGVSYDGVRHSLVSYDTSGRVQASGLVGAVERSTFAYTSTSTTVINAKGSATTYNYETVDGDRRLVSVDRPAFDSCPAAVQSVSYAPGSAFPSATTDWNGNSTAYTYLTEGLLTSIVRGNPTGPDSASSSRVAYVWDRTLNEVLEETHYERGLGGSYWGSRYSVINEYFALTDPEKGRIKSSTVVPGTGADPSGTIQRRMVWSYKFHPNGMVATITTTEGGGLYRTVEEFSETGALLSITNALSQRTTFSNHTALGRPRTIVDANGNTTTIGYDSRGRRISITREIGGSQVATRFTYNGRNQVTSVTHPDGHVESFVYDAAGRLTDYDPTNQSDADISAKFGYDLLSNVTSEQYLGGSSVNRTITYVRDKLGRLNQVVGSGVSGPTVAYDSNGNVAAVTDAAGNVESYFYNSRNWVSRKSSLAGDTTYLYDSLGNPTSVRDPLGHTTRYTYNPVGAVTEVASPDAGITTYVNDARGRPVLETRPDSQPIAYAYDPLDRPISITGADVSKEFIYDQCDNGVGRLCVAIDASGTSVSMSYTPSGALASQTTIAPARLSTVTWTYDSQDRVRTMTYPSGYRIINSYDSAGRLSSVWELGDTAAIRPIAIAISHKPFGPIVGMTLGSRAYSTPVDNDYRRTSTSVSNVLSLSYTYNSRGMHRSIVDNRMPSLSQYFDYDSEGRLSTVLHGSEVLPSRTQRYYFDRNGNRDRIVHNSSYAESYWTDSASNRLDRVSVLGLQKTFTYDAAGNTTQQVWGTRTHRYQYDSFGRMIAYVGNGTVSANPISIGGPVGAAIYEYNALNQRVSKLVLDVPLDDVLEAGTAGVVNILSQNKVIRSQNFVYDLTGRLLEESDVGLVDARELTPAVYSYVYVGGLLVARTRGDGTDLSAREAQYIYSDHLGRPQLMMDSSQTIWRADNYPYTRDAYEVRAAYSTLNLSYPGQYYDDESGLFYNWNRYYDPSIGRYLQGDPIGLAGGMNIYGYVGANPIGWIDPDGLAKCGPGATPVAGTNYSVRVDRGQPNTGQQTHAHIYDKKGKEVAVVNKDGSGSHGCDPGKDVPKDKKLQAHLAKKLFNRIPVIGLGWVCYDLINDPNYSAADAVNDQLFFLSSGDAN